jgi:uncharacterized protein YdiU (UPF0061 family)
MLMSCACPHTSHLHGNRARNRYSRSPDGHSALRNRLRSSFVSEAALGRVSPSLHITNQTRLVG